LTARKSVNILDLVRKLPILILTAVAFAQAPIQITTRLVQVVVIARDKHGPIADLTKGDFEILDKGKQRQIATFNIAHASDRVRRAALPPNTFSNRLDRGDAPITATVVLFDRLNTSFKDQFTARQQVLSWLKSIDPESPTAIYSLGNQLRILHDFTEDRSGLVNALAQNPSESSHLLNNSTADLTPPILQAPNTTTQPSNGDISTGTSSWLTQILEPLQTYSYDRRVAITFAAMEAIANHMAALPGRKNLIWVSGAFPLTLAFGKGGFAGGGERTVTYLSQLKGATAAIDRANVAVYPVDARGLVTSAALQAATPQKPSQHVVGNSSHIPSAEDLVDTREIETMQVMAEWTGGRAFYNSNDIQGALRQASQDAEVTYTLGFYAEEKELDGSYHELKVKIARKGADVRYRKGYFATPVTAIDSQPAAEVLKNALFSPADATALGLTASLTPDPAHAGSFILALGMDMQNLSLAAKNSRWADMLNFVIAQQASTGVVLDAIQNSIKIDVTDENRDKLLKEGITLKVAIAPAPGLSQIRVAVMDQATGNLGSLRIVPPVKP
jgi:VWFA-related protein